MSRLCSQIGERWRKNQKYVLIVAVLEMCSIVIVIRHLCAYAVPNLICMNWDLSLEKNRLKTLFGALLSQLPEETLNIPPLYLPYENS